MTEQEAKRNWPTLSFAIPFSRTENPYLILAVVCSAVFLDLLNLSAITIALPTLQKEFDLQSGELQWVISAYALTFGAFLLLGGRGGDLFGHKPTLLFGLLLFALFTMVSALTPSYTGLITSRAFQGIGAAFTIPSAQAHIPHYFPDQKRRARALGFWGASGSLGFIIGLILGGVLTDLLGWRWIFWISLILSGIIVPAAFIFLPAIQRTSAPAPPSSEIPSQEPKRTTFQTLKALFLRLDILGISLGLPGILLLTYALTTSTATSWSSPGVIATLITSLVLLTTFIIYENKVPSGILPTHLFRNKSFDMTLLLATLTYAIRQAVTYFLTLQLQSYPGNTPLHTSLLFLPLGISALLFNSLTGHLIHLLGARFIFILGFSLALPGCLLFSFLKSGMSSYWSFAFPGMILYIAGIGMVYITANTVVVSSANKGEQGAAAGVFNVALQVGGSVVGLAVLTVVDKAVAGKYGSEMGWRVVYYCCVGLCAVGLGIATFGVRIEGEGLRGKIWKKENGEVRREEVVEEVEIEDLRA